MRWRSEHKKQPLIILIHKHVRSYINRFKQQLHIPIPENLPWRVKPRLREYIVRNRAKINLQ